VTLIETETFRPANRSTNSPDSLFYIIFIIFQAIPLTMAMDRFVFKLMRLQKRKEKRKEKTPLKRFAAESLS
jgi:hypothetical protein